MTASQLQYKIQRLEKELSYSYVPVATKASIQDEIAKYRLLLNRLKKTVVVN